MGRERELFLPTLERIRKRADELFPDKLVYTRAEAAKIIGISPSTMSRKGFKGTMTAEQLARMFS